MFAEDTLPQSPASPLRFSGDVMRSKPQGPILSMRLFRWRLLTAVYLAKHTILTLANMLAAFIKSPVWIFFFFLKKRST